MDEGQKYTLAEAHKRFAVDLNQLVWKLLETPERSGAGNDRMLWAAFASLYHWSQVGTVVHVARGEWLVARVYTVLGQGAQGLHHARRSLGLCEANGLLDFDLAYGYEAVARASAACGDLDAGRKYYRLARDAGAQIQAEEDRKLFLSDLQQAPWFGLDPA